MTDRRKRGIAFAALAALFLASPAFAQTGDQHNVVFTAVTPLAGNSELLRRMLSPLAAAQARQALAASGKTLREQSINLSQEKFELYVPQLKPPQGYALLVFVPPWNDAKLPQGWADVLDENGMIFVSAARSGNDANVIGRREPLALLAAYNVMQRYPVDPTRVYVSGFSGGSRIALRLALGYPDLFRGALLNAGSDPLGAGSPPLPPKDLFEQFQKTSRIVTVTGEDDSAILELDRQSRRSLEAWCVFDVTSQTSRRVAHDVMDSMALSRALDALLKPLPPDPGKLAACRSGIEAELSAKVQQAESLIAGGKRDEASALLIEIDKRFGGLAAPRSVELEAKLDEVPR